MGILNEILEYLGSKDARITVYGTLLGLLVVYIATKITKVLTTWKKTASTSGKKSFNNFLIWLSSHYKNCPKWLKMTTMFLVRFFAFFGIKQKNKKYNRKNRR